MFYELIYTRCKQGMDILRKGQVISGEGYKVYSCSPELMEDGKLDLQFFTNAVQTKQSYNDPDFMDAAYIYYTPDSGSSFLLKFYPVTFDKDAQGNYSHRPGNFVNHAIAGDFSQKYPYELFNNKDIWYAQEKGEAYYYETPPSPLSARSDINNYQSDYTFEDIKSFIADGRKEVLKKAVSFLISQYEKNPEDRKYLVIKDDTSENIEKWIAAIECAFSPKIAAAIPFATRMDKFVNINRYTINQLGMFHLQMNLQDPKQKLRYRAMIVGVDNRDKANNNTAKPLANSPFVLLDGKEKSAAFEADISNEYLNLITSFTDEHKQFCRDFLQMFDVNLPNKNIFDLFKFNSEITNIDSHKINSILVIIEKLKKYNISDIDKLKEIYNSVKQNLSKYLQENLASAFTIIKWLDAVSKKTGEPGVLGILREELINIIYHKPDNSDALTFWNQVKTTEFIKEIAATVTDTSIINENMPDFKKTKSSNFLTFIKIYFDCSTVLGTINQNNIDKAIHLGLINCFQNKDTNTIRELISLFSNYSKTDPQEFFLSVSKKSENSKDFTKFIIDYMVNTDDSIVASDKAAKKFCKQLVKDGLGNSVIVILNRRFGKISKIIEYSQFIETVNEFDCIDEKDLCAIYETVDKKLHFNDRDSARLAEILLEKSPKEAKCNISLHICALPALSVISKKDALKDRLEKYVKKGFPNIKDDDFIAKFIECIIKIPDTKEGNIDQVYIIKEIQKNPEDYYSQYAYAVFEKMSKQFDKCRVLVYCASELKNDDIDNILINVMYKTKQSEKTLNLLKTSFKNADTLDYLDDLTKKALKLIEENKPNSIFSGLSGIFKKKDKEQENKKGE